MYLKKIFYYYFNLLALTSQTDQKDYKTMADKKSNKTETLQVHPISSSHTPR